MANGISITNSTIKNTLKLANAIIENADIDNLVLENKGKDHDSFLVQTSTVDGDKKSQGRIILSNCVVNVDDYFSISVHGNYAIGLLTNKEWEKPDYRQTLTIHGSEMTGENELRETTLVLNSILQNVTLANASEIRNSFLKEIAKSYEMPTLIEGQNLTADELKKDVGQIANEIEAL